MISAATKINYFLPIQKLLFTYTIFSDSSKIFYAEYR